MDRAQEKPSQPNNPQKKTTRASAPKSGRDKTLIKERAEKDRKDMERNLRLMLDYVGLEDEPTSVLEGNHPYAGPMEETELGPRPAPTEAPPPRVRRKLPLAVLRKIEESERRLAEEKGEGKSKEGKNNGKGSMPKAGKRRADPYRRPKLPPELSAAGLGLPLKEGEVDTLNPLDLNPIELARRIEMYRYRHDMNITQLSRFLGRSRSYVRNHLALLDLPPAIKDHVEQGRLTEGHARIIGRMRDPEPMANLAIRRDLSVRQVELMARRLRYIGPYGELLRETAIPNRKTMENVLEDITGLKVRVHDRAGRGKIEIHYNSPDEAQAVANGIGLAFVGLSEDDLARDY